MHQRDESVVKTDGMKNELLALLGDLSTVTQQLTDSTEQNNFEFLMGLVQQREDAIQHFHKFDVVSYRESNAGTIDNQVRQALDDVNERSRIMQQTMIRKSKALLKTLTSLQQNRYYSQ